MAEFKYNKVNSAGVNHGTKVYGRKSAPDVGVTDQKEGIDISYHDEKVGFKNSTFGYGATNSINIKSGDKELRIEDADLGVGDNKKSVVVRKILAESGTIGGVTIASSSVSTTDGFSLNSDGSATFGDGNTNFQSNGNIHIQGEADNTGVIYIHDGNDTKDLTGNAFRIFSDASTTSLLIRRNGNNRYSFDADGNVNIHGTINFGSYSSPDAGFIRDSGSIKCLFSASGNLVPEDTDAHDLGTSALQWDDVHANDTVNFSDRNKKESIQTSTLGLSFVNSLNPVSYKVKGRTRTHYGLIAQEVKTLLDSLSIDTEDFAGYVDPSVKEEDGPLGLRYRQFIAPMIKAIQELKAEVDALKGE